MDDALQDALDAAEEAVAAEVGDVLAEVADEFAASLDAATEIVAARFSVAGIARMWGARVPRLVRRLLGVAETAANQAATDADATLPAGWDDLPGRYDEDRELPPTLGDYVTTTEHLLRAVGDRLAAVAVDELAAGVDAGDTIDQLRTRLRNAFAREGAQLGPGREERIARTEAARAWNTATLAAAQALTGPNRPLVKQWLSRRDPDVRDSHAEVNGQLRLIDEPFTVAGVPMSAPGDPIAPPELVCNCRCALALARADQVAAYESQTPAENQLTNPRKEPSVPDHVTAAADGSHRQGAMIALMPTPKDAERLAVEGGEPAEELHLTLYFLGDNGQDWTEDQRNELIGNIQARAADMKPITARAFGAAHWNAGSDSPSWVWSIGDNQNPVISLNHPHWHATHAVGQARDLPDIPAQHSPWAPHVCAAYSDDPALLAALEERLGPVTFDRLRIAFAGDYTDIPLGPPEAPMEPEETTADGMPTRAWSTPDDTALAFENEETGDGRIFAAGSLYWDTAPAALQYADEMLMGHEGAELAGAIDSFARDGDRITGKGVLYTSRPAGADAAMLLEEGAPLGVSVDLDAVDVEFVDRTSPEEGSSEGYALAASLASASVMRLDDGAWLITASTGAEWTASGATLSRAQHAVQLITGPDGAVSAAALRQAFTATGVLKAAAGDPDDPENGVVVHSERTGDFLIRITRARLRGATLVAMPAYDRARIVLDPVEEQASAHPVPTTAAADLAQLLAAAPGDVHWKVVAYVSASPIAVGPRQVANALGITMESARGHLSRAATAGRLVRLARGLYVGASTIPEGAEATAAAVSTDSEDPALQDLVASAWTAMQDTDPMPAAWFQEPTAEELPPGSGGVHYSDGRVYGWVAQAGEPHAGMPGRNLTIDSLGDIDTTHFLRAKFKLDDGSLIRAGAMTMNVGHHRDGAECETASCQFDDTRTVAGIVTVGMNERGMWFSGAAGPWLSEWDRNTFAACQPSYHMKQAAGGKWQLRAVLSVPVPGHSSPLLASVAERSNLALAASAATSPDTLSRQGTDTADTPSGTLPGQRPSAATDLPGPRPDTPSGHAPDTSGDVVEAVAALLTSPDFLDRFAGALETREAERTAAREEVERLTAALAPARQEIAASMAGTVMRGEA
ncbi:phage minor head protein [Streptomyces sp. NBC_01591]|uniref:phage minor head protein n=1 Tax=Streptomyces sp. NBC_01591 TaxID=2975888 RepID=UPI002DD9EB21|nr:phage minor head protein [Streptomyces sp. NBC_01591]WSD71743.1 phage minor head protein [Streptomyces sp. NBC_01591]